MPLAIITGSSGFIGQHLTATFRDFGYQVMEIDIANPDNPADARQFFSGRGPDCDVLIHAAAVVGGRKRVIGSPLDHAENLEIDAAMFRWARLNQPGRVVYFSSSCAYPVSLAHEKNQLHEEDISISSGKDIFPDELYGWTKLTGEFLAITARNAGVPVSVVRPFSVYGPGVKEGFAVRGFADQIREKADPIEIWGNADQVRDFIHVTDLCNAILLMTRRGIDGPVNLGTGRGVSLLQLARIMSSSAGYEPQIKVDDSKPAGIRRLVADPRRLQQFYTPRVTLEDYFKGVKGIPG